MVCWLKAMPEFAHLVDEDNNVLLLQSGTSSEAAKYLTGTMSGIRYMKFDKTNYTIESTFIINKLLTQ